MPVAELWDFHVGFTEAGRKKQGVVRSLLKTHVDLSSADLDMRCGLNEIQKSMPALGRLVTATVGPDPLYLGQASGVAMMMGDDGSGLGHTLQSPLKPCEVPLLTVEIQSGVHYLVEPLLHCLLRVPQVKA